METRHDLHLHEEILLLALKDEEGTIAWGTNYQHAIGGAVVAELLMEGLIRVDDTKKKLVTVVPGTASDDPLLAECLDRIRNKSKARSLATWVSDFANLTDLKHKVARTLCRRGVLRTDEEKVLLFFTRTIYPEIDPRPEGRILDRMRRAVDGEGKIDSRTTALIALAKAGSLLSQAFDRQTLKERKQRIESIIAGDAVADATREALEAVMAAFMVAAIIPTVVTTTTN